MRNTQIAYCVTEGGGVPEIAEAKDEAQPSHQVQALSNEIKGFAGTVASLMEEKDQIINEQKVQLRGARHAISIWQDTYQRVKDRNTSLWEENAELKALNEQLQERIEELEQSFESEEQVQTRADNVSESEEEYCYGEGRAPYFTHYGSDSDNDFGETW